MTAEHRTNSLSARWSWAQEGAYYAELESKCGRPCPQPTAFGLFLWSFAEDLGYWLGGLLCKRLGHGKHWHNEGYGGPDSGGDGGYCDRCGFSFWHQMY